MSFPAPPLEPARPLLVLAAALSTGVGVAWALGPATPEAWGVAALFAVPGATLLALPVVARHRAVLALAGLCAGLLLGVQRPPIAPVVAVPDQAVLTARVLGVERRGGRTQLLVSVHRPAAFRARLGAPPGAPNLRRGDWVLGAARLHAPGPAQNPGLPDPRSRPSLRGLARLGRFESLVRLDAGPTDLLSRIEAARGRVASAIARVAEGEAAAVLAALALGAGDDLPAPLRERFAEAGLAHLLAVSGLHLGLAAILLVSGLRRLLGYTALAARAQEVSAVVGAPLVGLLVLWVDRPPSAARAGIMALVLLFAAAAGRQRDAWLALAAALVLGLASDPDLLARPGFQLSFAAVAGLLGLGPLLPRLGGGTGPGRRVARALLATGGATLAASLATAPLTALHFGRVPILGSLANLVAVPLTGLLVPAVVLGTVGSLVGGALLDWAWAPALLGARLLVSIAEIASALPYASVAVGPPGGPALAGAAACLIALGAPRVPRAGRVLAAAGFAALLLGGPHLGGRPPPAPLEVVFLSVGHGDSILVRTPQGDLLVDAGGDPSGRWDVGAREVVPALRALGVRRLRAVVATHPDPDHVAGLPAVLAAFPVGALHHTGEAALHPAQAQFLQTARRRGIPVRISCRDPLPDLGPVRLECLWPKVPFEDGTWDPLASANDNSIVLAVSLGAVRFLLPGDLEAAAEQALVADQGSALGATVVKAPHHGSATSSTEAFVRATGAEHVVFSVGARAGFGFPKPEVEARWRGAGARSWKTADHGAIRFLTDGRRLRVLPLRP